MGACVSTPQGCVGGRLSSSKKKTRKRRREGLRRRVTSRLCKESLEKIDVAGLPDCSFANPTFQGSIEEAWFDSVAVFDSDCDDDYQSVPDDVVSLSGIEGGSVSSFPSSGDANHGVSTDHVQKQKELLAGSEAARSSDVQYFVVDAIDSQHEPVFLDEISSVDANSNKDDGLLDNCGILPNNCLPCLVSTIPSVEKRRSTSSSPPNARKKPTTKLSFKWKEGHGNATLFSSKMLLQRPIAGSQVPFCPIEKKMLDCWSQIDASTFKVRGVNYFKDKKKDFAPNYPAYYPFGVDVFLSPRKVDHIARFVELPVMSSSAKFPPILVVNVQVPLYPATLFQGETDGEGMSIVLYFKLSESYSKELPQTFQESIRRLMDDEVEKVKGFPVDTIAPFRERVPMAVMLCGGASSSAFGRGWTYDVFLSFRGEDTRRTFTGSLYHGLHQRGINVFIDDEKLRRGEEISPALIGAIEESRIAIIVFSQNYASSTWCLDELAKILECYKTRGQLVWPVFFHVDPSAVRHQRGSFATAMAKHEDRFKGDVQKLQKWKMALFEAANLSGWTLENGYEFKLIQEIIEEASRKLNHTILHIAEYPVGIENRISELKLLLHIEPGEDIRVIGIYGLGGIGKTTIARALYNLIAGQFEATSFLTDIRESSNQRQGLVQLQETLLFDTVGDKNIKLGSIYKGIPIIKKRLCCKKVLLILDDVDKLEQLQALAGGRDWFGFGSVIIITTRDKHLLAAQQVDKTYEVKKLNHDEAFDLFTWSAFKRKAPDAGYFDISNRVVLYAEGLPLALKVMGSNLFGKTVEEWKSALGKYEKIPNKEVQNVLRVTFDNLEENEKEIFLDIACFFKGETMEYIEKTLQACGLYPKFGISVLVDRSLVSIDKYDRLRMHDLIQDMGREIVREVSPLEPGKRSRLWYHEDVFEVLSENTGTYRIQGMMVDLPDQYTVHLKDESFKKMRNLKILIVRSGHFFGSPQHLPNNLRLLDWMEYPSSSLPSSFQPKKLVVLNLSHSRFTMQEPFKYLDSLTSMDLTHCELLTKLPDITGVPNLTELHLDYCTNLEEVHDSVGFLEKLVELRAYGCTKLKVFPSALRLASLRSLILNWCSSLQNFPAILGKMDNLKSVSIDSTGIRELPPSIGNLVGLQELSMTSCLSLKELPDNFDMLQNLINLDIEGCPQLRSFLTKLRDMGQSTLTFGNIQSLNLENCGLIDEDLPIIFHCFPKVSSLVLSKNDFVALPICIQEFPCLELLHLDNCKKLQEIPGFPPNIQYINARNCTSLTAESSNLLLSQETFEECEMQVMVPGTRVPEWFDHITKGEYMTFWVREKFPATILCFALAVESEMKESFDCEIRFYINGDEVYELEMPRNFSDMVTDHVWLYDLRTHPSIQWRSLDLYLMDDWNQVEISCEKILGASNVTVSWCGVHVIKQETNMKDILFADPDPDLDSSLHSEKIDIDLDTDGEESTKSIEDSQYCNLVDDNCYINFETPDRQMEEWWNISKEAENNRVVCHTEMDQNQDKNLLPEKTLYRVTEDSLFSLYLEDIGSVKASGSNSSILVVDHPVKNQPQSQVTGFIQTPNVQEPRTTVSMDHKVTRGESPQKTNSTMELPTTIDSLKKQTNLTINDADMEAFYAVLDAETSDSRVVSKLAHKIPSEETKKALKTFQDFVTKDFSVLLGPSEYSTMKDTLDYLTNLPAEDGISVEIRSLVIQVSRQFTHWSKDYTYESKKLESTTAKLLKADELEEGLEANKTHFKEVMCLENELCSELAYLEQRKKELEEQINAVKSNISASQAARNMASQRKREIFGEAKILKAQRDGLREQMPHLRDEQELAKKIKANIREEWSKLGEKFNNILRHEGFD